MDGLLAVRCDRDEPPRTRSSLVTHWEGCQGLLRVSGCRLDGIRINLRVSAEEVVGFLLHGDIDGGGLRMVMGGCEGENVVMLALR